MGRILQRKSGKCHSIGESQVKKQWEGVVKRTAYDLERQRRFIMLVHECIDTFHESMANAVAFDPKTSLALFIKLRNATEEYNSVIQELAPQHQSLLSRGIYYIDEQEAEKFFQQLDNLPTTLSRLEINLNGIIEVLRRNTNFQRKGVVKNLPRKQLVKDLASAFEEAFGEEATEENEDFSTILTQILKDEGVPTSRKDRIFPINNSP